MAATRRTHIVRIKDTDANGNPDDNTYVDIEIMDAIAFRIEGGREVILNINSKKADPYIVDDLNLGVARKPAKGTRRSHMKQVGTGGSKFAIEQLDACAYRDTRGEEWILKMPSSSAASFNITDGKAEGTPTRRTHSEKIYINNDKTAGQFITSERCDAIAFRHVRNKEVILKCPSFDDESGDRATTIISNIPNYDPTDDNGPEPPSPEEYGDKNVYFKFVKGYADLNTGKAKVSCGPFWWIRKVHRKKAPLLFVNVQGQANCIGAAPGPFSGILNMPYGARAWEVFSNNDVDQVIPGGAAVPVSNPVTADMRKNYFQWHASTLILQSTDTNSDGAAGIWYAIGFDSVTNLLFPSLYTPITLDNYLDKVGVLGCGNAAPVTRIGFFNDDFCWCCNVNIGDTRESVQAWASDNGFDYNRLVPPGLGWNTQADVEYYISAANALSQAESPGSITWSAHFLQTGQGAPPTHTRFAQANFIIDLGKAIPAYLASLPNGTPTPEFMPIPITFASTGGSSSTVSLKAQPYFKRVDFPVDALSNPTWTPALGTPGDGKDVLDGVTAGNSIAGGSVTITLQVKIADFTLAQPIIS